MIDVHHKRNGRTVAKVYGRIRKEHTNEGRKKKGVGSLKAAGKVKERAVVDIAY